MKRLVLGGILLLFFCLPASAQFNGCPVGFCSPAASGGGGSFSLAFANGASSSTTTTTTINFGTVTYPSGCSALVLAVQWYGSGGTDSVSGLTVGGSAASHLAGTLADGGGGGTNSDGWQFNSPTGTSANITATFSANVSFTSSVSVYCLKTTTLTVSATNGVSNPATSVAIAVPSGGGGIVWGASNGGGAFTWSGGAASTGDFVASAGGANQSSTHTTSTGSLTVSPSITLNALSAASWGP